tara:strand:- start:179 stop:1027 length:849 start_codon:yes stop_codon:yes gene_type:complete
MNVLSLFDGMSCGQIALNRCGIKYENYFASEIKKHAIEVTQHNYPKTIQLGNIKDIKKEDLPQIDLILAGSPCQDFSRGNKTRDGLDGQKSSLFFEFYRLYKECKPKYFILENVIMPPADYEYLSRLMETYPVRINSSKVSAQFRDRLYWTNIGQEYRDLFGFRYSDIPQPKDKKLYLKDILTSGFTDKLKSRCLLTNTGQINENQEYLLNRYKTTGMITIVFEKEDLSVESVRTFNQIEMERLQTVPENYTSIVDVNKASDLLGDGWTVDVISHILNYINK